MSMFLDTVQEFINLQIELNRTKDEYKKLSEMFESAKKANELLSKKNKELTEIETAHKECSREK